MVRIVRNRNWLYLTQSELRETRVIRCSLGSLPGPEKVPLFVRLA